MTPAGPPPPAPAPASNPFSYNDLVGKIARAEKVRPSRPRERSPSRGDTRPLEVQQREEAKNRRGGGAIFQGGHGREEPMARRSKILPKEDPKRKVQEHYIGEQGVKRKREATSLSGEEGPRPRPNPARGSQ